MRTFVMSPFILWQRYGCDTEQARGRLPVFVPVIVCISASGMDAQAWALMAARHWLGTLPRHHQGIKMEAFWGLLYLFSYHRCNTNFRPFTVIVWCISMRDLQVCSWTWNRTVLRLVKLQIWYFKDKKCFFGHFYLFIFYVAVKYDGFITFFLFKYQPKSILSFLEYLNSPLEYITFLISLDRWLFSVIKIIDRNEWTAYFNTAS